MIWKGSDSQIPEIEFRIVEQIIIDYYDAYFNGFTRYTDEQREVLLKNLFAAASRKNPNKPPREVDEMVRKQIEVLEARRAALKVSELNFNSFFDYSFDRLEQICTENDITVLHQRLHDFGSGTPIVPKFLTEIQITGDSQSHTVSYFKSLTACIGTIL